VGRPASVGVRRCPIFWLTMFSRRIARRVTGAELRR
jgi:hypothetical protein